MLMMIPDAKGGYAERFALSPSTFHAGWELPAIVELGKTLVVFSRPAYSLPSSPISLPFCTLLSVCFVAECSCLGKILLPAGFVSL